MFLSHHSGSIQPIQVKYKLFPRPLDGDAQKIINIDKAFGNISYVYKDRISTTSNGTVTIFYVFINIDNSKSLYHYRFFTASTTSAELLKQVNGQGAKGFRYKVNVRNKSTDYFLYVQDASRPLAKYIYRHEPCVSNQDELFAQINRNAARGYRVLDSFLLDHFCVLYIKDRSQRSKFIYKMVSDFNSTEDLLAKANQLGDRGYRYVGYGYIDLVSNDTNSSLTVPLYYRDTTQKRCTLSYSSAAVPDSPANALALLQEQEEKGFIYDTTFSASNGSFLIFVKFHNCHYKSMNIDAFYWFLSFFAFLLLPLSISFPKE